MSKQMNSLLKQGGFKLTPQRRAVLDIIARSHERLTPAAIYEKVHRQHPQIGLVTVYRTLDILTELGLICEVHSGGNCRSYLLKPDGHHHHLICSDCGSVVDFPHCDLEGLEKKLSKDTGFEIESHLLEFLGRCRSCQSVRT